MKQLRPFVVLMCLVLSACSGMIPQRTETVATKTLLGSRQTIIGVATTTDALCTQGQLTQAKCDEMAAVYAKAIAAYNVASDALLLAVQTGNWSDYQVREQTFLLLANDINVLARYLPNGGKP